MIFRRASKHNLTAATAAVLIALTGCASTSLQASPTTVVAAATQQAELSTFTKLVQQAGLQETLQAQGPFTVFAPSDEAFKAVPAATLDALGKDPEQLKAVLLHHVVPGRISAESIKENSSVTTVGGNKIGVSKAGDFVTVEEGLVVKANVQSDNGVIHIIDTVLMPPKKK